MIVGISLKGELKTSQKQIRMALEVVLVGFGARLCSLPQGIVPGAQRAEAVLPSQELLQAPPTSLNTSSGCF